jgi:hypothetical protein
LQQEFIHQSLPVTHYDLEIIFYFTPPRLHFFLSLSSYCPHTFEQYVDDLMIAGSVPARASHFPLVPGLPAGRLA